MTGNNSKRQRTWRILALVLLAALLGVGSCSYLAGQNPNRPGHEQASTPGHGAGTAAPGAGATGSSGSSTAPAAGSPAIGTAGPGAANGTLASTSGTPGGTLATPGGTPAAPETSAAAPTAEPESASTHGTGSTTPPADKSSTPSSPASGGSPFSVSVSPAGELYPGAAAEPLDLSLTNPNGHAIALTSLTVSLKSITLSASPRSPGRCTTGDFQIAQFSGSLPISVGAGRTVTLYQLGFPAAEMPEIRMVDQPYNQDGCQGARLSFSYSGTATG